MVSEQAERLLDKIGQLLIRDTETAANAVLLYAMIETNMVGSAVFEDRGNQILYCDGPVDDGLTEPLLDLWEEWPKGKRWEEMEYVVRDGKFDARFVFSEEIDRKIEHFERRDRIVRRYFGDKPIVYPPWDDDEGGSLRFEL